MDYQTPIGKRLVWKAMHSFQSGLIGSMIILFSISACQPNAVIPSLPRGFTTRDLLIDPSLFEEKWDINYGPTDYSPNVYDFRKSLGVSTVDLKVPKAHAHHIVAVFPSTYDAARAYQDHDYTRDTRGRFPESWHEISDWNYESPLADQFRVVCAEIKNVNQSGASCVIETQYEEFLSIVLYSNSAQEETVGDLEAIAKAIDARMEEYLGKKVTPENAFLNRKTRGAGLKPALLAFPWDISDYTTIRDDGIEFVWG